MKPDGVQRRLVGEIVQRFERKGFQLVALKLVQVGRGAGRDAGGGAGAGEMAALRTAAPSPPSPGLGGAAARALRGASRAPLLRPPGQVHGLGARGGHGECRAGRRADPALTCALTRCHRPCP